MPKILYWNVKQRGDLLLKTITSLSKNIDILVIAELNPSKKEMTLKGLSVESMISTIESSTGLQFSRQKNDSWLYVWFRKTDQFDLEFINVYDHLRKLEDIVDKQVVSDSEYFATYLNRFERMLFYKLKYDGNQLLLVPIHFPSRLYASVGKQKDISVHFKTFIEDIEKSTKLDSVVFGDFNMNPFEPGMVHQEGFHALPDQRLPHSRTFYGKPYQTFYNPSWVKLGDHTVELTTVKPRPSGSYFQENSTELDLYWYVFDQVILRKKLLQKLDLSTFKYLTGSDSENEFLNSDLTPNAKAFSDHLPIFFELK